MSELLANRILCLPRLLFVIIHILDPIKYTEMATQTVGVCNVLSNMDEVFGHSYHLSYNGGNVSKMPEQSSSGGVPAGNKQEKSNRDLKNPGGATITNTAVNSQQQQMPPSYETARTTSSGNCTPTRAISARTTVSSNGGPALLVAEKSNAGGHQNGNNSTSKCDALL